MAFMNLLRKPIIATPSTIHSARAGPKTSISSSCSATVSSQGTRPSERATAIVASSARLKSASPPMSAEATLSADAPRRSANEQACALQYGHSATRLDTYMPSPTSSPGAPPTRKIGAGRFRKFGTMTL
jgi:hypothetical protein